MSLNLKSDVLKSQGLTTTPPVVTMGQELGRMSIDGEGQMTIDDSQMRYLHNPWKRSRWVELKVLDGFDIKKFRRSDKPVPMTYALQWSTQMLREKSYNNLRELYGGAEIVTHYRAIEQLGYTPYFKNRLDCDIIATKYKGVIFVALSAPYHKKVASLKRIPYEARGSYAGRRFQMAMTSKTPETPARDAPVDEVTFKPENHSTMSLCRVGDHEMALHFGVDCYDPKSNEKVKLRSTHALDSGTDEEKERMENRFKMERTIRLWINLYLTGTSRAIFGFLSKGKAKDQDTHAMRLADDRFIVESYLEVGADQTGLQVKGKAGTSRWTVGQPVDIAWEPAVCLASIDRFLTFVKEQLAGKDDLVYRRFIFANGGAVTVAKPRYKEQRFLRKDFLDATADLPQCNF